MRSQYDLPMKVQGYMIVAEYDGNRLCLDGTNKAARVALRGAEHDQGPVEIPIEDITEVALKSASVFTNGKLVVQTRDGKAYTAHFRRKQQQEWVGLHSLLGI